MRKSQLESEFTVQSINPFHTLASLLQDYFVIPRKLDREVSGLSVDSRKINPGDVFIACAGFGKYDGRDYIQAAVASGAAAVISEAGNAKEISSSLIMSAREKGAVIPHIQIPSLASKIGHIAATFYGCPSQQMQMVGVTGTNGKTSITTLLIQVQKKLETRAGLIGTHGKGIGVNALTPTGNTTPGALQLQKILADFREQGCESVAMEITSHAICQHRVNGVSFDTLVLSNVTRDHLDYHENELAYREVKKSLFSNHSARNLVVNLDDQMGKEIAQCAHKSQQVIGYTLKNIDLVGSDTVVRGVQVQADLKGMSMLVVYKNKTLRVHTKLIGSFSAYNILAVVATLLSLDYPFEQIIEAMDGLEPVPGNMQLLGGGDKPVVVVDFAHTPSALEAALTSLQRYTEGKLICVFGCGGDRDTGKRKKMGAVAEKYADHIVLTDDNPRTEPSDKIINDIIQGLLCPWAIDVIPDRTEALVYALNQARAGDLVLVAGKGRENYQLIGDEKLPFSDAQKVKFLLDIREQV